MANLDKYKITRFESEELKPEETLADSLSIHPAIESPIGSKVFTAFYSLVGLAIVFIVFKSFQLQIIDGKNYALSADKSNSLGYQPAPLRGIIYDSNGKPVVENVPNFDLVAVHRYLPSLQADLENIIDKLSVIVSIDKDRLSKLFEEGSDQAIFVIKKDISKEDIVKVDTAGLKGIYTVASPKRHYLDGPATAHLVGYTTQVTQTELEQDPYYSISDRAGRLGLENQYESELRGQHKSIDPRMAQGGNMQNLIPGSDLYLNIDFSVQKKLYQALSNVFKSAGVRRGAAIVQNPKTGAVIGLVSMPSFDSNFFENSSSQESAGAISNILKSSDKPLLDRVVSGRYSPGSTIKPLLALAGLKEGVVTPATLVFANGSISVRSEVDPNVYYTFNDWRVHGWTDIKKAIANSVDIYFYQLGGGYNGTRGLGIDRISSYIKGLGADKLTEIDLPGEITGFVPSKEWKKETKGEGWYVGDTYNISIGQGDLGVTPVWINTYVGGIANGGSLMKPQVVKEIKNPAGKITAQFSPEKLVQMPFDKNTMDIVRQGMRQTVLTGTATMLQDIPVALGAKTGTAQITGKALNSLFTVFGPYDDPEVVMTVLVENINQSQGLAIRVANDFLLWYFTRNQPTPTPSPEAGID